MECLIRWQQRHRLTIYATSFNEVMLHEFGVDVRRVTLAPYFDGPHSFVLNASLLPMLWEQQIGEHDVYHTHLWPTHLIDRHPQVWYPHEPPRMLTDLRHSQPMDDRSADPKWRVHCYPKYSYDAVSSAEYEASLRTVDQFDQHCRADRIVANSRLTAGNLQRRYGRPVTDVVYPGIDPREHPPAPTEDFFLTVGQHWPHKRHRLILEALAQAPGARLVMVGNGPEHDHLREMATSLQIADRVQFRTDVPGAELRRLYQTCRAVVFTAYHEPFGIVVMEALAAGRPVIATGDGGYAEIVDPRSVLLVPPIPAALAQAMLTLVQDPVRADQMGAIGRRIVSQYTWSRTANELLAIIEATAGVATPVRSAVGVQERPAPESRPLVAVQYYGWYGDGSGNRHWNDNAIHGGVTDQPTLGYYSSIEGSVLREHLLQMESAGIDAVIVNLHVDATGVNPHELAAYQRLLGVAAELDSRLRLAPQWCVYGLPEAGFATAAQQVRHWHRQRPGVTLAGRTAEFVFWTGQWDGDPIIIDAIRQATDGSLRIASSLRLPAGADEPSKTLGLFDAWSMFSPVELSAPEHWSRIWQRAYDEGRQFPAGLGIVTVSPGYDDRHLTDPRRQDNPYRVVDRAAGQTYRRTWDFARTRQPEPDLVIISTFNEYHENTHIEPTRQHGDLYLQLTAEEVRRLADRR